MKKLVIINSILNKTSTGVIAENIGLTALNNGWDVVAAYGREVNNSKLKTYCIDSPFDIYRHVIKSRLFDAQGLGSTRATKKLVKLLHEYSPSIIHIHNLHGYYINYKILFEYIAKSKTPVVWTMHDCWSFTGHCTYFDIVKCNKWKYGCISCPIYKDYPRSLFDRASTNFIQKRKLFTSLPNVTMVPVSKWLGDLTSQSYMGIFPIKVIHNGIDINMFRVKKTALKNKLNLSNKKIVLGVASNGFSGRKGLADFIGLSKILTEDYQIIMIGLKQKELNKIPSKIIGKMRTSNVEELVDYYNIADVFINPTYSDNFPTTNIESLACGTPVITYDTGGSPEAIDSETGIVIKQGDIASLAQAIIQITDGSNYSIRCRSRAEKFFNKENCFQQYMDLYEELIDHNRD